MPPTLPALWNAIERFAHARGAVPATFLWNLGQGSVVPGPSELLLAPLTVADPAKAWRLAIAATLGSVLGGCVAYAIGAAAFTTVGQPMLQWLGVEPESLTRAMAMLRQYGWLFIIGSTITPVTTKGVCIGAGAAGIALPVFVAALTVGRLLRFLLIVTVLRASSGTLHAWGRRWYQKP
jgi:membrane protein YqaA with SNARE-associated domain